MEYPCALVDGQEKGMDRDVSPREFLAVVRARQLAFSEAADEMSDDGKLGGHDALEAMESGR